MRRYFIIIILALANTAYACPPSTGHCIVELGCSADLIQVIRDCRYNYSEPTGDYGFTASVGYESPKRWSTISVKYKWFANHQHYVGAEYMVNLIPYWVDSPVSLHVPISVGYVNSQSLYTHQGYANTGIEFSLGYLSSPIQWFMKEEIGFNFVPDHYKGFHCFSTGIKLWLGRSW